MTSMELSSLNCGQGVFQCFSVLHAERDGPWGRGKKFEQCVPSSVNHQITRALPVVFFFFGNSLSLSISICMCVCCCHVCVMPVVFLFCFRSVGYPQ